MTSNGRPAPCRACQRRPRARTGTVFCYDCEPGGPFVPPPCRRCGSSSDYYSGGLCGGCHYHAPARFGSCRDCHAWGVTRRAGWLCRTCELWRIKYPVGVCASCKDTLAVGPLGLCRLCWRQAANLRPKSKPIDPADASRYGQQLHIANLRRLAVRRVGAPRPAPLPAPWPSRPVTHRQLLLCDVRPDLSPGRGVVPAPRDAVLADALHAHARDYAARRGWNRLYLSKVRSGIRILLGLQHTPGAAISTSEALVLGDVYLPVREVLAVLADVGMHHDDQTPAVERWFDRKLAGLPDAMVRELRVWFDVMRHGSTTPPRRRPRSETTIRVYINRLLPTLRAWASAGHDSLRDITRDDILTTLATQTGSRTYQGQGMRSVFGILHQRKVIFGDPTARIRTWADAPLQLPQVDLDHTRRALQSPNPARAALAGLVAFHGLASGHLRDMLLTDIHDRRLHLDGRTVLLAGPVLDRLTAWLDHRNTRWPNATNPHLFITFRTAQRHVPVSYRWLRLTLDLPGAAAALRSDRIHDEANATDGDIRRLCDLFGLSVTAATRYANTLDHPDLRSPGGA